jgi:hypothetical protein
MLRSNTDGSSYSQAIRIGGEVDASRSKIREKFSGARADRWIWFDGGRFIGSQQQWRTGSGDLQEARENPYVEVLDLPEVPERQSFPPRLLIIATGTGCAVILSGVWILGVARWREIDAQHAGMVLAREIFGTVRWRIAVAANRVEQNDQSSNSE